MNDKKVNGYLLGWVITILVGIQLYGQDFEFVKIDIVNVVSVIKDGVIVVVSILALKTATTWRDEQRGRASFGIVSRLTSEVVSFVNVFSLTRDPISIFLIELREKGKVTGSKEHKEYVGGQVKKLREIENKINQLIGELIMLEGDEVGMEINKYVVVLSTKLTDLQVSASIFF